jgi:sulfur-oxidizing protein SoxZ
MANVLVQAPRLARRGEVVEIKAMIQHPMESGFRPGSDGKPVPRNIIERFTASWNGTEIVRIDFSPAIAANPFVSFFALADESGTVLLRWQGDAGFVHEERIAIAVA